MVKIRQMSKYTIYTVFDVQSNDRLRSLPYLLEFVKTAASYEFNFSMDSRSKNKPDLDTALEIVTQNRNRAIENHRVSDILHFENEDLYLSTSFEIANWNLFVITVSSNCFPREKTRRLKAVRSFVRFCEVAYNIFAPDYGYGLTNPELQPIAPLNLQVVPDTIFDLNFFGPEMTKRIGKEKLSACPTWRTVNFDDGGSLLELSEDPVEQPGDFRDNYIKTANILGINKTQLGV